MPTPSTSSSSGVPRNVRCRTRTWPGRPWRWSRTVASRRSTGGAPRPRDVAFWRPEHGLDHLEAFLAPCAGRLVAADAAVGAAVAGLWSSGPAPWSVRDYSFALLEHLLPAGGPDHDFMIKLGLGETEPWRRGWRASAGHPDLEPPRSSTMIDGLAEWSGIGRRFWPVCSGWPWAGVSTRATRRCGPASPSCRAVATRRPPSCTGS